ncbi:MAG: hypothetical protein PUH73_03955 [Clostridium sp.]|nr:hypothetical protein [Clostridium sp.]
MKHEPSFLFRRKEAKENQIGGCVFLALPRGHGCIVKHGSSFLFRRKEAKENQIGGCAILTLPRGHGCIVKHGSSFLRCHRPECRGEVCLHPQPIPLAPQCLLFLFFKKRKRSPSL